MDYKLFSIGFINISRFCGVVIIKIVELEEYFRGFDGFTYVLLESCFNAVVFVIRFILYFFLRSRGIFYYVRLFWVIEKK